MKFFVICLEGTEGIVKVIEAVLEVLKTIFLFFQGFCFQPDNADDYVCQCVGGYGGTKCDRLEAVSFTNADSFLAFEPPNMKNAVNLTMTLITEASKGIIFYYGNDTHVAAELFEGRIKVSYYIGNYPASIVFSMVKSKNFLLLVN